MLGKYEVVRKIATGGMAEIYLARVRSHAGFEKLFVVKRILPSVATDPRLIQLFLDEARLVATLQHPNIADVYEVGDARGAPYFVMEHVHGQDVRAIRIAESEREHGVPLRVSLALVHATASALEYAHARCDPTGVNLNLVHRDVSPSNIVVSYEGAIKLIDFGVARVTGQRHRTQAGTIRGKYPYMSPEQCRGLGVDRRSDLFSLGVVLYELTVGKRPFVGANEYEIMNQIVHHDPTPPSKEVDGYPRELERMIMKLLSRDPRERYQTGEDLLHDIEAFVDDNHLWVPHVKLSRYMRKLFADRLVGWDEAARGDISTLAEHLALGMEPGHRRRGPTPPTPLPVIMRLSQEINAVALDADVSLARVYQPDDPGDPMSQILGTENLEDSVVFVPTNDTLTGRTDADDMAAVLESSITPTPVSAPPILGETIPTREPQVQVELPPLPPVPARSLAVGTKSSSPFAERATTAGDPGGDTTTVRKDSAEVAELSKEAMAAADADSVMRALHAPSFIAAIDALGSFEGNTEEAPGHPELMSPGETKPGWPSASPNVPRLQVPKMTPPPLGSPAGPTAPMRSPRSPLPSWWIGVAIAAVIAVIAVLVMLLRHK